MMATWAGSRPKLTWRANDSSGEPGGIQARSCSSDIHVLLTRGSAPGFATIPHRDEDESFGRRCRSCARTITTGQNFAHPSNRASAAADLDERADNRAHHVSKKSVGGHFVRNQGIAALKGCATNCSCGVNRLASGADEVA